jgi:tetratricopeptide (TPR) repeat protein
MGALNCPGEETIVAFAAGRLATETLADVEAHALHCALCQDLLAVAMGTASFDTARPASPAPSAPSLRRGAVLGRYTILTFIGRGGMGEVYAAYDPELDRRVAIKLLRPERGDGAAPGQSRLLREAQAMARVAHRNVVAVHDVGTVGERVFVAMELVDGVTLQRWLATGPRTPREILAVFVEAARGLGAAHAAGLVHRDFKPGNVMVAKDGGARVTDFGLAGSPFTTAGELVGTPAYMAPEQLRGESTDARSDQFGFCVALYDALYGERPFGGTGLPAIRDEVLAGRVRPPPAKSTVPAWLRRALLHGLAADPAARWPSMEALAAALASDPARARRRRALTAGAAGLVALSIVALVRGPHPAPHCTGGPERLEGVWEAGGAPADARPRRDAIRAALFATGAPAVDEVWERVAGMLDKYAGDWLAAHRDACEATQVRHEQSPAVLELRMSCLEERRGAMLAVGDVLAHADRDVVSHAVDAVDSLPALARCNDLEQLRAPVAPPRDEATRRRVADGRARLSVAKALNDAGKHDEALKRTQALVAEARAIGYDPLVAEALLLSSTTHSGGQEIYDSDTELESGVWAGLRSGRDDIAAALVVGIAYHVGWATEKRAEHEQWSRLARALLDRMGPGHELILAWHRHNEGVLRIAREPAAALAFLKEALALKERALPAGNPDIARTIASIGDANHALGNEPEALAMAERAHAMFVKAYGPSSTEAAYTLSNSGEYLIDLGRAAEAVPLLRDAAARWSAQSGPTHPNLGYPLTALGRALLVSGQPREAVPVLERALAVREGGEPNLSLVAETGFALAQALWSADQHLARARVLAADARAQYVRESDDARAAQVEAWLAAHPARAR